MTEKMNGIDVAAFQQFAEKVTQNPEKAKARFNVETRWAGQTRSVSTMKSYELFGDSIERTFHVAADEPSEILGSDTAPNPQELLMAALNACQANWICVVSLGWMKMLTPDTIQSSTPRLLMLTLSRQKLKKFIRPY